MSKRIERPSGYFSTFNPVTLQRLEGETRQCVHCGMQWLYDPKDSLRRLQGIRAPKPRTVGKCLKCFGLTCSNPECLKNGCRDYRYEIEQMEKEARLILTP